MIVALHKIKQKRKSKIREMGFLLFIVANLYLFKANAQNRNDNYQTWCLGNCEKDAIVTDTKPGIVLMGGGTDTEEAFLWQISNANGGDFVVLRASGDDAYNSWIYDLSVGSGKTLNSVTTILTNNKKASSDDVVINRLKNAEAIFFAGGDQSVYLDYWVGTDVQTTVQSKLRNITIGGTSAGCAILGNWVYSGEKGSVTSDQALVNPYHKYITIEPAFLQIPYLETIITDTHFVTRDRMGRMLTFMARILEDYQETGAAPVSRAVGVDEHTALLLDVITGSVSAVGVGTAYVCSAAHRAEVCDKNTPLTFSGVQCVRLSGQEVNHFSFATWTGEGVRYPSAVMEGTFSSLPYGPL